MTWSKRFKESVKTLSEKWNMGKNEGRTVVFVGVMLALGAAFLAPSIAQACCTNVTCDYCISSSTSCDNRCTENSFCVVTWAPTCNTFGCNCNNTGPTCECGTRDSLGNCVPVDCCADTVQAANAARARFKTVDTNGDGKIDVQETQKWLVGQFGKNWMTHVDRTDVAEQKTEPKVLQLIFDRLDTNHDKGLTPGEFDSSLAAAAPPAQR